MTRRPTHLAARALCWCAALLALIIVARAVSPLAAALVASIGLNVALWRRQHTRAGVPPYIVAEIHRLRARLDEREQALRAAITANTPRAAAAPRDIRR